MGELYWDPGNLLQITSDEDEYANIQCVGRARRAYGSRCRWSVPDSERATAHRLILELAGMMPSEVMTSNLSHLAAVCLCQYHVDQKYETVERWIVVAKRAAKQYEYLRKSAAEERDKMLIADLHMLRTGGGLALGESSQFTRIMKDAMLSLNEEKAVLQGHLQGAETTLKGFREAYGNLEGIAVSLRTENDGFREKVESLRRENEELRIGHNSVANQFWSASTKIDTLRTENDGFREKIESLRRENQELGIRHDSVANQFRSASTKIDGLHDEIQRLGGEIEVRDRSLQQSQVELQEERGRGLTLQDKVTTTGQRITALEANISTCWLHAFCMWINRQLRALATFALYRGTGQQRGMFGWSSLTAVPR